MVTGGIIRITATIVSCHEVVQVPGYSWVLVLCHRYGEKDVCCQHLPAHSCTELLHLFSYISQESIRTPSTDQHDGKNWNAGEVHGHCGATPQAVQPYVFCEETQFIDTNCCCCCSEFVK